MFCYLPCFLFLVGSWGFDMSYQNYKVSLFKGSMQLLLMIVCIAVIGVVAVDVL